MVVHLAMKALILIRCRGIMCICIFSLFSYPKSKRLMLSQRWC